VATLTEAGLAKLVEAAPGHVAEVRARVFDVLTADQLAELDAICTTLIARLDAPGACAGDPPLPAP
jgi:hypothetical protein